MLEQFTHNDIIIHVTDDPKTAGMDIPEGFVRLYSFKGNRKHSVQMPFAAYNHQDLRTKIALIIEEELIKHA